MVGNNTTPNEQNIKPLRAAPWQYLVKTLVATPSGSVIGLSVVSHYSLNLIIYQPNVESQINTIVINKVKWFW